MSIEGIAHAQRQIDTRAIEIAAGARQFAEQAAVACDRQYELLRDDIRSIGKALWTTAIGSIGLLLGWLFYVATNHPH